MLELVEQKIDEAINSITNADFEINPKNQINFLHVINVFIMKYVIEMKKILFI